MLFNLFNNDTLAYVYVNTCKCVRFSLEQGENLEDTPPWLILTVWRGGGEVEGERQDSRNRLFGKKSSAMIETSPVILSYLHNSVCFCVQMHK